MLIFVRLQTFLYASYSFLPPKWSGRKGTLKGHFWILIALVFLPDKLLETIIKTVLKEDPDKYHYGKEEDNEKEKRTRVRKGSKQTDKGEKEKKSRKSKKSNALIDNSDDTEEELEEGEVLEEETEENKEEQVSDDSLGDDLNDSLDLYSTKRPAKRKKLSAKSLLSKKAEMPETSFSAYEKVQAQNIAEKEKMRDKIMNDATI